MESTEKCDAVISHFNGKFIKTPAGVPGKIYCVFILHLSYMHTMYIPQTCKVRCSCLTGKPFKVCERKEQDLFYNEYRL